MSNVDSKYDDLSKQIDALKSDVGALTSALGDLGVAERDRLSNAAKETARSIKQNGTARYEEARDGAERFVQTQPATAMGLAAALGFVVGAALAPRR